jgi:RNA recognition motif-containing protein
MLDQPTPVPSPGPSRINIYVGNLSMAVTETELRQAFAPFGRVVSVSIMNDVTLGTSQPRVYAFVGMTEKNDGEAAIAGLDGKSLGSQVLSVISALPLSPARKAACCHSLHPRR